MLESPDQYEYERLALSLRPRDVTDYATVTANSVPEVRLMQSNQG